MNKQPLPLTSGNDRLLASLCRPLPPRPHLDRQVCVALGDVDEPHEVVDEPLLGEPQVVEGSRDEVEPSRAVQVLQAQQILHVQMAADDISWGCIATAAVSPSYKLHVAVHPHLAN